MIAPVVGSTVAVPSFGPEVIVTVVASTLPSTSVSFATTSTTTEVSSFVDAASLAAKGGSFSSVIVIDTVAALETVP